MKTSQVQLAQYAINITQFSRKSTLLWTVLEKSNKHVHSGSRKSNLYRNRVYFNLNPISLIAVIAIFSSHAYASCDELNSHRLLLNMKLHTYDFTRTQPKFWFRDGSWMISSFQWRFQSPTCSLYGARRNISYGVLLFVLWAFCISTRILIRAHVYGWFHLLLCNGPFQELRRLPEDDTYDVSKHVGDLLKTDVNILVHVIFVPWHNSPSGPRPTHYRGFTVTIRHTTLGGTPLDEWSARRRDFYLTSNTDMRQPCPRRDSKPQSQQGSGRRPTP